MKAETLKKAYYESLEELKNAKTQDDLLRLRVKHQAMREELMDRDPEFAKLFKHEQRGLSDYDRLRMDADRKIASVKKRVNSEKKAVEDLADKVDLQPQYSHKYSDWKK